MINWPEFAEPELQVGDLLIGVEEGDRRILDLGRQSQKVLKGDGAEAAEHEQRTVREVDDPERPEH